jgi:hypothetical protein
MSFIAKFCVTRHQFHVFQTFVHRLLRPNNACVSFSELENDTLNQAELNEIKINENN